jgi:drug/metabolite transporter (DMT)-like permease
MSFLVDVGIAVVGVILMAVAKRDEPKLLGAWLVIIGAFLFASHWRV